jgi:4-amino-4-deoxy-L-arabinose transferase-like glycosyltransferase/membrane-associated phospholipid phosphatase
MSWLEFLDVRLFRLGNQQWSNSFFDLLMPVLSEGRLALPLILLTAVLLWRRGRRGRLCLFFLVLVLAVGDGLLCNPLKHAVARERPCHALADARVLVGCSSSGSMPSAHATNWFAATAVMFWFYRRSLRFMLPLALAVAFSRIYVGVHYPSDVAAGAALGVSCASALLWGVNRLWQTLGRRQFPLWQSCFPSLLRPDETPAGRVPAAGPDLADRQWLRLGYLLIGGLLLFRLGYLASGTIELSEDEAYQWLWSKHPDLSYYSKPPLIAYAQLLGTWLWGDTEFGIRFFSPVIAALLGWLLLRFLAREADARTGFGLMLLSVATPLLAVGATLMTIDSLSVFFWTAAMLSGWQAVRRDSTRAWIWTGLWMGLGFLSKYVGLFQWVCWGVFFLLWPPARAQWRRPGPYLALAITLVSTLPVLVWNARHHWITLTHLEERGGLDTAWEPTLRHLLGFLGAEAGLLNPVLFVLLIVSVVAFWRRHRQRPLMVYCFSMGAPLFLFYLLLSLRAPVLPNWVAPSVIPLFCLMALHRHLGAAEGARVWTPWLVAGGALGLVTVAILHETDLVGRVSGWRLPARLDPLRRVRGWDATAQVVESARARLEAEGTPAFVIGDHYGLTSLLTFYLPGARQAASTAPRVYCRTSSRPRNQFYFWPGYDRRQGQNALYVRGTDTPKPVPPELSRQFKSVTDLGIHPVLSGDRVVHAVQLFECRDLR